MPPRTLIPLSLALAWAGAAQAADHAAWPALSHPAGRREVREVDAALVIAIEDYTFAQDLPGARQNGRDWATWLHLGRGVPTVKVLEDSQATREEILAAAEGVAQRVQSGGRIWVIFIGHGAPSSTGDGGMLVGVDAQQTARSLEARSVRLAELEAALQGQQSEVILIQDACFSGKAAGSDLAPGLAPMKVANVRLSAKWTVLAAGQNDQYAGPLSDGSRPAFSYLTLGALRGWGDADDDGFVTAAETVAYAKRAIFETTTGRSQEPELFGANILLAPSGGEKGPDLAPLASGLIHTAPPVSPPIPSPPGPARGRAKGAAGFTTAGALGAAGIGILAYATLQRQTLESQLTSGELTYNEGVEVANQLNKLNIAGYTGLGLGVVFGLGTGIFRASTTATAGLHVSAGGTW